MFQARPGRWIRPRPTRRPGSRPTPAPTPPNHGSKCEPTGGSIVRCRGWGWRKGGRRDLMEAAQHRRRCCSLGYSGRPVCNSVKNPRPGDSCSRASSFEGVIRRSALAALMPDSRLSVPGPLPAIGAERMIMTPFGPAQDWRVLERDTIKAGLRGLASNASASARIGCKIGCDGNLIK